MRATIPMGSLESLPSVDDATLCTPRTQHTPSSCWRQDTSNARLVRTLRRAPRDFNVGASLAMGRGEDDIGEGRTPSG